MFITSCFIAKVVSIEYWGVPWPQTGTSNYNALLGLQDKGRAINGLVVCNNWDLEPMDLLNGLALGCYQRFPEVLIVLILKS